MQSPNASGSHAVPMTARSAGSRPDAATSVQAVSSWTDGSGCSHDDELRTLRRDVHDQIGSCAAAVLTQLQAALSVLDRDSVRARDHVELAVHEAQAIVGRARELSSTSPQTRPRADAGHLPLRTVLTEMIERMNRALGGSPLIALRVRGDLERLPSRVAAASFWIIREALTNVFRHADAHRAWVACLVDDTSIQLSVVDDAPTPATVPATGQGLENMFGRARELGGTCTALPVAGGGFRVAARLPLRPDAVDQR